MKRSVAVRRLVGAVGVTAAAAAGVVGVSALPAVAAAGCVKANEYAVQSVFPSRVAGVTDVAGAQFGASEAIGDFNHDGFADVAIGAPADKVGTAASGSVYVFKGSATGIVTSSGIRLTQTNTSTGNEAGDRFGAALAAGDFNKDGFTDLAVGIPGEAVGSAAQAGAIAVFNGKAAGLTTGTWMDQDTGAGANEAGDLFGSSLAAGDLNGDGFADLAIGTPGEASGSLPKSGSVYVYKGSSTGPVRGWVVLESDAGAANETGDQFGTAVAIGNVTGDSHADLVVGAPNKAPGSDPAGSGEIYVVAGAAAGKGAGFSHSQEGVGLGTNEAGDHFGAALAVGDFDKDGHADIAAGIPGEAPNSSPASGTVGIVPGAASGVGAGYVIHELDAGETLTAGDKFGNALATGDVNGDGFADLLVGAPGKSYDTATAAGAAFLFTGGPRQSGSTVSLHLGRRIGQNDVGSDNEKNDAFGAGVAMGDITGDGKAEAMIGVSGESRPGFAAAGTADQLSNLAIPATASVPIGQFSPMAAMQASPAAGATLGTVEYAYTDNIGRLVSGHQTDPDNAGSVQFTVISGLDAFTGQPALDEQDDGRLQVFAQNINGQVWANTETTKNPQVWGSFTEPPVAMKSAPVTVRESDGTVVAFAVDANGVLWGLPQDGTDGPFLSWVSLGIGGLVGSPVAVMTGSGVKLFVRDTTGDIKTANYSAKRIVSGCVGLNGTGLTGTPSVVVLPGSRLRVFAQAADGSIVTQAQDDTGAFPGTWDTVGTFTAAGAPSALLDPLTGKIEVVALGADGAIYNTGETTQGSGVWRDWAQATVPGDNSATDPTAFLLTNSSGAGWAFVFRNSDNVARIYQARSSFAIPFALTAGTTTSRPAFTAQSLPAPPR